MTDLMKELIAVGASVTAHCQPCLAYHVSKARELGAGEDEITAAIEVGQMVQRGAANEMKKFTTAFLAEKPAEGCGCKPSPPDAACCL